MKDGGQFVLKIAFVSRQSEIQKNPTDGSVYQQQQQQQNSSFML